MKNKLLLLAMGIALSAQTLMAQVPSYVPTNGLVGYWPFSGNANDASGNGNNGTVNGSTLTSDRFGNTNGAYSFDGVNDFISVPSNINFTQNPISYSFWFNKAGSGNPCNGNETFQAIFSTGNFSQSRDVVLGQGPAKRIGMQRSIPSGCQNENMLSTNYTLNTWNHAVVTYEANLVKVYLNGVFIGSSPVSCSVTATNTTCFIGASNPSIWACIAYFNGLMDDIGIWNRVLNQQEITTMYNGIEVPSYSDTCNNVSGSLTQGLVGYWPFCGNANDDSGNGNNGTVNGASLTTDRFGNSNSAYSFNGQGENIRVPSINNSTFENDFSISLWCKNSNFLNDYGHLVYGQNQFIVLNNNGPIYNSSSAKISGYQGPYDNPSLRRTPYLETNSQLNINTNYHVVYTKSNNIAYIYINGVLENSISTVNTLALPSGSFIEFGSGFIETANYSFNGTLDDIGIWNRALSQQEITNLYNANQCITNITVTDTLIINVGQLSYNNPVTYANNITMAPNPASTQININFNNITNLNGGTLKVINSLGQEVASTPITTSGTQSIMQLATWGGSGMYFVQIINPQGQIVDIKKIILQ